MTKKESLGFWRDMWDWHTDPFEGTSAWGGLKNSKPHPRGCRGCDDAELSWWCSIYFFFYILYGLTLFTIGLVKFALQLLWLRIHGEDSLMEFMTGSERK